MDEKTATELIPTKSIAEVLLERLARIEQRLDAIVAKQDRIERILHGEPVNQYAGPLHGGVLDPTQFTESQDGKMSQRGPAE